MPVRFPDYYEFESINPAYHLNPNTKSMLEEIWGFMTNEHTLLKCAPEGLLVPYGYKNIQKRMAEVRYLAIVPKELSEEIRRVMKGVLGNNSGPGGDTNRENPEVEQPDFILRECPNMEVPENDRERREEEDDPLPGIGSPWPWDVPPSAVSEMPSTGSGQVSIPTSQGASQTEIKTIIHTYDYFGQYFSSARAFCSIMAQVPGRYNYQRTLARLEMIVNQSEDCPLIVICPENVEIAFSRMPAILANGVFDPTEPETLYKFGLKKVFVHEMGHHLFPVFYRANDTRSEFWPECIANWFAYHLMSKKERLGMYIWTLRQPIQYRSYIALLGLSMRNEEATILGEFVPSARRKIITGSELSCANGENPEVSGIVDRIIWRRSFYHYYERIRHGAIPRKHALITPAEAMWQMLTEGYVYKEFYHIFQHFIGRGYITVTRISNADFNKMIEKETDRKPLSIGFLRSGGTDLDFML